MNRMKRARRTIFGVAVIALLLGTIPSNAQPKAIPSPSPARSRLSPGQNERTKPVISTEAPVVNLDVLVTDEDGLFLGGLKKENFRVLDNGKPQTVSQFEPTPPPARASCSARG
jgi:hypothetical protein